MRRIAFCLAVFSGLLLSVASKGQSTIRGTIVDKFSNEPLPFAHAFISGTMHVAISDAMGQYELRDIHPGVYLFAVSFIGYETVTTRIPIEQSSITTVNVRLAPEARGLDAVVIAGEEDNEWKKNFRQFKKGFLGQTRNASLCEIQNPWVVDIAKRNHVLRARASEPVEIVNRALGYRLHFYLQTFSASNADYSIIGPVRFETLNEPGHGNAWSVNRRKAFLGSQKHFFRLLWNQQESEEGFRIYKPISALGEQQRSSYFQRDLNQVIHEVDIREQLSISGDSMILNVAKPIEVHYEKGQDYQPLYKDVLHQVSWIESRSGKIYFNKEGNVLNPQDVEVLGYWNHLRVGDLLPLGYDPDKDEEIKEENESLQIVTDRDTYGPGEMIWYAVMVESGSRQSGYGIHVMLVDSTNSVVGRRFDPIELRQAHGHFQLPDTPGSYFISAYTASGYRRGEIFVKPILITRPSQVLTCERSAPATAVNYKMNLTSSVMSADGLGLTVVDSDLDTVAGHFIVSVTGISTGCDCLKQKRITFTTAIDLEIDDGAISGVIRTKKGKPVEGTILLMAGDLSGSIEIPLGSDGRFDVRDVVTYDSTKWLAYVTNAKGKPVEDFVADMDVNLRELPLPSVTWSLPCVFEQRKEPLVIRTRNYALADSTKVLEEVTIRGRKMEDIKERANFRVYGLPTFVVTGETIRNAPGGVNILNTLAGRVPGLRISESVNSWTGNASTAVMRSVTGPPLVLLDGVVLGTFSEALPLVEHLSPMDIERVEVRSSVSPLMGSKGSGGIIAIYTRKTGQYSNMVSRPTEPNLFVKPITLPGYSKPLMFNEKSISDQTVHWNPVAVFPETVPYEFSKKGVEPTELEITLAGFSSEGNVVRFSQKVTLP